MDKIVFSAQDAQAATKHEDWGSLMWLAAKPIGNATGLTLGRVTIKKGQCNPRHTHFNCEEVLYLLKGKLEHTIGDDKYILNPGDTITAPAGIVHNAISIGDEDAEMIVAFSSIDRDFVPEK